MKGDFAIAALRRAWTAAEERLGSVGRVEILGSVPVWYGSPRATWLRLLSPDDSSPWCEGSTGATRASTPALGGSACPSPLVLQCVPTGPDVCTAADLVLKTEAVRFQSIDRDRAHLHIGSETADAVRRRPRAAPGDR
jgi:hypothetical protein